MESLLQDLRYAVRQLAKKPWFTLLAIATVAVGIGPTTAVISVADRLVMRPLPGIREPARLAMVQTGQRSPNGGFTPWGLNYVQLSLLQQGLTAVSGIAGYQEGPDVSVAIGSLPPERRGAVFVNADYFRVLGLYAQLGRAVGATDDAVFGEGTVALISDRLWAEQFGRERDVLEKTMRINGELFSIIGVAPRGFHGIDRSIDYDIWLPGAVYAKVMHFAPASLVQMAGRFGFHNYVARLARGTTFDQAQQDLKLVMGRLAENQPGDAERIRLAEPTVYAGVGTSARARESLTATFEVLFGVAALVWIVSCANLANLLLARAARRRGETAVRQAIGASNGRLLRAQLVESVLLASLGGVAGLVLAVWLTRLFEGMTFVRATVEGVHLNWRVLALSLLGSTLTGLLVGILPTQLNLANLAAALQETGRAETSRVSRVRRGLTVVQLATSLTLLIGAFLFGRTLWNLRQVDLGFDPRGVTSFTVSPRDVGYTPERMQAYFRQLLARLEAIPGVQSAALSGSGPLVGMSFLSDVQPPGEGAEPIKVVDNTVTAGYFRSLGIEILGGRVFSGDAALVQPDQVILSEQLAKRLFGDRDPVGQSITIPARGRSPQRTMTVVALVRGARWAGLQEERWPVMYTPFDGTKVGFGVMLTVRSEQPQALVVRAVRDAGVALDASLPLGEAKAFTVYVDRHVASQRMFARVLGLLSFVSLALASVGLYGLMTLGVAQRIREFGLRRALGAEAGQLFRLVIRQALVLSLIGVVTGAGFALALARVVSSRLYGVSAVEPAIYVIAAVLLVAVALGASFVPARAATRVDPMIALRSE